MAKSLNRYLKAKYGTGGFASRFRFQARVHGALYDIEEGDNHGRSANSWAVMASILGSGLVAAMEYGDCEHSRKYLSATADRLARCLVAALHGCHKACKRMEADGIDPQVKVNILPRMKKAVASYRKYEEWQRTGRNATGRCNPCIAAQGAVTTELPGAVDREEVA